MAKRTAEKVSQKDPELIIPVDEFNRDKLGEDVARKISGFIGRKAKRFGMPLHNASTLRGTSKCLDNYFGEVCGENLTPDMRRVIYSVRLTLNRYYKSLGIDLVSVNIEPRDEKAKPMLAGGKDLKAPTLGVVGASTKQDMVSFVSVGFKVNQGAEQLHVLSDTLEARGFGIGEPMPEWSRVPNWSGNPSMITWPWSYGSTVTIPAGAMVALNVPVLDLKKLDKEKIPYKFSHTEISGRNLTQGVYFCRYLTREAVAEMLKDHNDPPDFGDGIPPSEKE